MPPALSIPFPERQVTQAGGSGGSEGDATAARKVPAYYYSYYQGTYCLRKIYFYPRKTYSGKALPRWPNVIVSFLDHIRAIRSLALVDGEVALRLRLRPVPAWHQTG
jgi:hypothetical protein